jgi:hypothetical protein
MLHDLADHAATGMATVDLKGRFTYVNQVMADFMGHSAQDLMGHPFKDYIHPEDRGRITRLFLNIILLRRAPREVELRAMGPDGTVRHLLMRPSRIRVGRKTVGFAAVMIDITKRKQMEERLKESEEHYRELADSITDMFFAMDRDLRYTHWNRASETGTGISAENAVGKTLREVFPPSEERRKAEEIYLKAMREQQPQSFVNRFTLRNREYFFEISAFPTRFGVVVIAKDITERMRMEEEIRSLAAYPLQNPNPVLRLSREGIILHANPASKALLQSWGCKVGGEAPKYWRDIVAEVFASKSPKNGDVELDEKVILFAIAPVKDASYVNLYGRDITERKRMGEERKRYFERLEETVKIRTLELSRSEARHRLLLDNMADAVFTIDLEGNVTFVNPSTEKLTGYPAARLLKMNMKEIIAPEYYRIILERLQARIRGETYLPPLEFEVIRADGEKLPIEMHTSPVYDEKGTLIGVQGIACDITDRRRTETELRASEEKFRHICETSLDAIYKTSLDGKILEMSPPGVSMFGFENLDELRKANIKGLYVNPDDRIRFIELADKGPVRGFETRFRRKDGKIIDAVINSYALRDGDGRIVGFQGAIINTTERRRMERMRGQFISAVTHELRTPLVSIKGYVDLILEGSGSITEDVQSNLHVVRRNTDRLLGLVNDLLDLSRMQAGRFELKLQPIDFKTVIQSCMAEAKPLVEEKKLNVQIEVPENPLRIQGDQVRLCQVLMNLLSNATKFSSEGGDVTLRVEEENKSIKVQVSDRGIGIRKEDLERVFEPFSAIEKPTYVKGTGLGLSVCKGLVEAHGGKIWVESAGEGEGAKFTFTLPK